MMIFNPVKFNQITKELLEITDNEGTAIFWRDLPVIDEKRGKKCIDKTLLQLQSVKDDLKKGYGANYMAKCGLKQADLLATNILIPQKRTNPKTIGLYDAENYTATINGVQYENHQRFGDKKIDAGRLCPVLLCDCSPKIHFPLGETEGDTIVIRGFDGKDIIKQNKNGRWGYGFGLSGILHIWKVQKQK